MFSTLQRPTATEEAERRKQRLLREAALTPARSVTNLRRKESVLARGFNALFRRDSLAVGRSSGNLTSFGRGRQLHDNQPPHGLFGARGGGMAARGGGAARRGSRAMSFRHPERISHIPPPEVTRLRSRSQHSVAAAATTADYGSSGSSGYVEMSFEDDDSGSPSPPPLPRPGWPNYGGGPNAGHLAEGPLPGPRERFRVQRRQSFMPPRIGAGYGAGRGGAPGGLNTFRSRQQMLALAGRGRAVQPRLDLGAGRVWDAYNMEEER